MHASGKVALLLSNALPRIIVRSFDKEKNHKLILGFFYPFSFSFVFGSDPPTTTIVVNQEELPIFVFSGTIRVKWKYQPIIIICYFVL